MTNQFWDFSLVTYAHEHVAEGLLALQEECGLDVNVLLYACWLASKDVLLTRGHLEALETHVAQWHRRVVLPLRRLRQELRSYSPANVLRDEIKALELRSEHQQQDLMWSFYLSVDTLPVGELPLEANLDLIYGSIEVNAIVRRNLLLSLGRSIGA
jgi:uncharacterized protein (TIGR02444 family)